MAKPKLALIPATQGSKLYSVLPADGVGDFNFSRGSAATRINSQGLIETVASGVSRLNYPLIDGVVKGCPSHLLEPQRTNLLTYSSGFVTDWNNTNITINSNSIISPDGTLNATKLTPNTTSGGHYLDRGGVSVSNNALSSIFAKKGEYKRFAIRSYFTGANAIFDVNEGIIVSSSSVTAKIEDYGNGWYRCSLNETLNANYGYGIFVMEDDSNNASDTYSGNGIDGMYFYGASLEIGSFISSYIPTTNSAVTRSAETANGAGNATTFNDSEGVLMAEISSDNTSVGWIGLGSNSANRILLGGNGTYIRSYNNIGGTIIDYTSSIIVSDNNKIAIKYKSGDTDIYINGFKLFESNSAFSVSSPFDEIQFKNLAGETQNFYGSTKQIQYFDSALNDSDLETLTSWVSFTDMANGQLYTIE